MFDGSGASVKLASRSRKANWYRIHAAMEALSEKIVRVIPHSWRPKPKTTIVSPTKPTPAVEVNPDERAINLSIGTKELSICQSGAKSYQSVNPELRAINLSIRTKELSICPCAPEMSGRTRSIDSRTRRINHMAVAACL